ncbi:hypothetical protein [Candidatus Tisiphia endosymbiont of Nedyus quadrimaculatus]|uniref:hypothetical protein n=1 Tax=Candidatus Tisiphia endosymbiont of Nedyus quadrimaculatus TaxID=3139332 RepID=UPI00345E57F1
MSKDRMLLERFSTTIQLLKNEIDKIERAKKLFATDSSVHEILKAADLEKCCNFVKNTESKLITSQELKLASRELKVSLKGLYIKNSTLLRYDIDDCRNFEERSDQIDEIIQARKLLKCIDQHDFKEALKIAGLSYIIKESTPWISRILENTFFENLDKYLKVSRILENTFLKNLDEYLEVKRGEYETILEARQAEYEREPSAPELPLSTPPEGSSNCNNTYVTTNNHPAADSAPPSVLPLDHLCPQLPSDITTISHTMNCPPKARKVAPLLPAPPPYSKYYSEAVHDVSDETLLGDLYHHN